ncbi:RBP11-like subunits of RNA polymerase [Exidia glandulosa HHB12029]|uniref:DNA-directed RNA polymerases I and III subunit RPAC2 n=1 Tax=Exidia glandulosa HHB12029 TaxID=1314781 RepID=A0A165PZN4_EXIGL|nr:RBP11-like subunits of RNA polymerase [Exidia glandulosa HHB12029]
MAATDAAKITIMKGYEEGYTAATFALHDETHTIGNALRWMLMKNPKVEFCGYSAPHPSEPVIHLRIQMYDNASAITALTDALENLDQLAIAVNDQYRTSLRRGAFERFEEE